MTQYWPGAKCVDNGKEIDMFTYGSCLSIEKALECVKRWNEIYWVKEAWIDVDDDDNGKCRLTVTYDVAGGVKC